MRESLSPVLGPVAFRRPNGTPLVEFLWNTPRNQVFKLYLRADQVDALCAAAGRNKCRSAKDGPVSVRRYRGRDYYREGRVEAGRFHKAKAGSIAW